MFSCHINYIDHCVITIGESSAKKTLSINDEEDEWMESSSDQSVDNDDDNDGDFIADDESGDELEDSADDDDDDDASDDVDSPIGTKRKSKSSKAVKKTTKTSKTPKKARTEKKTPVITPTSTIRNKMNHTLSFVDVAAFSVEKQSSTNNMSDETPMEIDSPRTINPALPLPEGVVGRGSHEHNSFDFLFPEKRRDKNGRRPTDPDYNPRTLFVPNDFLKSQTPAMVQWWYFKADNMDTVLFFKVKISTIAEISYTVYD